MSSPTHTPLVLIIRDGWGQNPNSEHDPFNAVKLARTPVADRLEREWPTTLIRTSGEDVGLPDGTMGNSEVGHQNIGAGRIVDQDSVRITKACREARLGEVTAIAEPIERTRESGGAVHLMGIASDAGVHGLLEHLEALVRLCAEKGHGRVFVHLFTDGRDTGPYTGAGYVERVESMLREVGVGRIATVMGRYWSMDRDNRWERVARAYACLTGRETGASAPAWAATAGDAVRRHYDGPEDPQMKGDEFLPPTRIGGDESEAAEGLVRDGDAVIFYNYRGDRPRELVSAFVLPEFEGAMKPSPDTERRGFDRGERLDVDFVMMTGYSEALTAHARVAFPKPPKMRNIGGEFLSSLGLTQFRCAETEKFPHVTFFFNDYREEPFEGEHREIVQSPKVSTYDQQPEMSAAGVRDAVLSRLRAGDCEPVLIVNFANPDMVGHTGNMEATVRACETVDACVGAIVEATLERGGCLIVTADHGNAEQMWDPETEAPHTAHTIYNVPLTVVGQGFKARTLRSDGRLADILPTMLDMLELEAPEEMTGRSLLEG